MSINEKRTDSLQKRARIPQPGVPQEGQPVQLLGGTACKVESYERNASLYLRRGHHIVWCDIGRAAEVYWSQSAELWQEVPPLAQPKTIYGGR